jgi:hypothetical protein
MFTFAQIVSCMVSPFLSLKSDGTLRLASVPSLVKDAHKKKPLKRSEAL